MGASTNATTVLYGTPWDGESLLDETREQNLELERRDGIKRHFQFDWQEVAKYSPLYARYVEGERQRLGEEHPLFRSQYLLLPVRRGGGFFSACQRAQLQAPPPRLSRPVGASAQLSAAGLPRGGRPPTTRRGRPIPGPKRYGDD